MTTTRTHFALSIDLWDSNGENIIEHLAGVEDFLLAMKTYRRTNKGGQLRVFFPSRRGFDLRPTAYAPNVDYCAWVR